jgi:hypothetical protein
MTTAYDITHQIRVLVAALEASGGEADDDTEDALRELLKAASGKVENLVYTLGRLKLEQDDEKAAEARHKARRTSLERAEERVRSLCFELVQGHLELTGEAKIRTEHGTAYVHTTVAVEGPEDPAAWPEAYRRTRVEVSVDKRQALADLKAGLEVPGARLEQRVSLGVRRG